MDPASSVDAALPAHFDRYSILGHLATGGMAEVYLAHQAGVRGFEKLVVIKRIRPELLPKPDAVEAFLDEARLVATLEHPHIVAVHEIGFVAGTPFFVMEHVDGVDLRQLLEASLRTGEALSLANALYIAIDVCAALHYAHERCDLDDAPLGIVHRDMSPSNVLVSHEGGVKICDFGIAKAATRRTETHGGMVKGKFSYMSPEQCTNAPLDRRSDVFALGILLYELTTRTRLFPGTSDYQVMRAIVEQPIPPPSTLAPDYPPELEQIVMRALARDPDERYQSACELQTALEELAREQKLALSSTHLAALMGRLFPVRAVATAEPKPSAGLGTGPRRSSLRLPKIAPSPLPVRGSRPFDVPGLSREIDTVVLPARVLSREVAGKRGGAADPARPAVSRARRGAAWLAGAVLSAAVAVCAVVAASRIADAEAHAAHAVIDAEAARVAVEVERTALRLSPAGGHYHLEAHGSELFVVVAPMSISAEAAAGALVGKDASAPAAAATAAPAAVSASVSAPVSSPVELAPLKRRLASIATRATIELEDAELVLFDGARHAPVASSVPIGGGGGDALALIASPASDGASWLAAVGDGGFCLSALFLFGFVLSWSRRR